MFFCFHVYIYLVLNIYYYVRNWSNLIIFLDSKLFSYIIYCKIRLLTLIEDAAYYKVFCFRNDFSMSMLSTLICGLVCICDHAPYFPGCMVYLNNSEGPLPLLWPLQHWPPSEVARLWHLIISLQIICSSKVWNIFFFPHYPLPHPNKVTSIMYDILHIWTVNGIK